jgi:lipoprotein-releasing system ATP-binding protein
MNNPILKAEGLTKRFLAPAPLDLLTGIDLEVARGESVAIVGKSGEGKTTLLHILGTLDQPSSGKLYLHGSLVTEQESHILRNRHLGFVFQAFHLLEDATVLENILMPLSIARQKIGHRSDNYKRALDLLKRLGLYERRDLHALKLSGGEKQRLGIGRAFITNPDLILADEPTGNLDHQTAASIQHLLLSWVKEEQKALIVVTHSVDLAKACDRSLFLESGKLYHGQGSGSDKWAGKAFPKGFK